MTAMELTPIKFDKLFSTPVFRFKVNEADRLNFDLLAEGERLRLETDGVSKSNKGGWHSSGNLFDNNAPCVQYLKMVAKAAVISATRGIGAKADLDTLVLKLFAWMNANPTGGFNAPHTHPGAHWSGVYYITQPDVDIGPSGKIEFLAPRTDLPNWRLLQASAFNSKKSLRPMPGEMILFPSYLVHWVYPNETPHERISIAFNATFKKKPDEREAR